MKSREMPQIVLTLSVSTCSMYSTMFGTAYEYCTRGASVRPLSTRGGMSSSSSSSRSRSRPRSRSMKSPKETMLSQNPDSIRGLVSSSNSCWCSTTGVKTMAVNDESDVYREKKSNIFVLDR